MELEKDGWAQMEMLLGQDAQMIAPSNHKLKSDLSCTVWSQSTSVPDRQTTDHRPQTRGVPVARDDYRHRALKTFTAVLSSFSSSLPQD